MKAPRRRPAIRGVADRTPLPADTPSAPRWFLPVATVVIVAQIAATLTANGAWSCAVTTSADSAASLCRAPGISWLSGNPLGLLALSSATRFVLLTAGLTAAVPGVVVATARMCLPDPFFYGLGWFYRDRAESWGRHVFPGFSRLVGDGSPGGGLVARLGLDLIVFIAPNNAVCLVAGLSAMPRRRFVLLSVTGSATRVVLLRWIAAIFGDQLQTLLDAVERYQRWVVLASVIGVGVYIAIQLVGRRGLIGGLETIDDDLGSP